MYWLPHLNRNNGPPICLLLAHRLRNRKDRVPNPKTRRLCWITEKLVKFVDYDNNVNSANFASDAVRDSLLTDEQDLATFFARPIYGTLATWTPGSNLYGNLNPWNVFFNNKRVANRLSNFKLSNARLHIKFMLNGSPFHYGRMLISYIPLHTYDTTTLYPPTLDPQLVWPILGTQRMKVFLDPSEGMGAEMVLPFVWPYDAMDLSNGDFNNLGNLFYTDLNTLKHANAATSAIQVTYAIWAENVNMGLPTSVNISGLVTQGDEQIKPTIEIPSIGSPKAGRDVVINCTCCSWKRRPVPEPLPFALQGKDEYSEGPVSKVASAVAQVSGALTSVPMIGPLARATEIGARAGGDIARLFGFSKPNDLAHQPSRMIPRYVGDLANADGFDTSFKLSVDSKQEHSIDPSIVGVSYGDELALDRIAERETFITQFTWTTVKASGDLLWNARVNPYCGTTSTQRLSPACEFAALPFDNWRGHMAYRIQVVASRQHRGRLAILWDPNYVKALETNVVNTTIIDLDETRDVVIKIPWGQRSAYLTPPSSIPLYSGFGTVQITSVDNTTSNGVLAIYCMNELAVPNSVTNNDIQVNVYACLCDADFAAPNNRHTQVCYINQGEEEFLSESKDEECAADGVLVAPTQDTSSLNLIYFGEKIASFRQLFKRFCFCYGDVVCNSGWTATTSRTCAHIVRPKFPPFRGAYLASNVQAIHVSGTSYSNRVMQHMVTYVSAAFLCSRGGQRLKHVFKVGEGQFRKLSTMRNGYSNGPLISTTMLNDTTITTANSPSLSYMGNNEAAFRSGDASGASFTVIQPVIEVDFPYYYSRRFDVPRDTNSTTAFGPSNCALGTYEGGYRTSVECTLKSATDFGVLDTYVAASDDFSCVWFQGMPPWTIYS